MNVLLTGAFGNIGMSTLSALLERGHKVRTFDLATPANRKSARRFAGRIETVWGDLRDAETLQAAVEDQEVVIHLGFLIPKLSVTGMGSEEQPDIAWEVNVGGTHKLLDAMRAQPRRLKLIFASSYHVYGLTQNQPPPRTVNDPVNPVEHYARHKVACEWLVKASGLEWSILRFSATLPLSLTLDMSHRNAPRTATLGQKMEPSDSGSSRNILLRIQQLKAIDFGYDDPASRLRQSDFPGL